MRSADPGISERAPCLQITPVRARSPAARHRIGTRNHDKTHIPGACRDCGALIMPEATDTPRHRAAADRRTRGHQRNHRRGLGDGGRGGRRRAGGPRRRRGVGGAADLIMTSRGDRDGRRHRHLLDGRGRRGRRRGRGAVATEAVTAAAASGTAAAAAAAGAAAVASTALVDATAGSGAGEGIGAGAGALAGLARPCSGTLLLLV